MNQKRLRGLVLVFFLLFVVFWIVISSATNIDAKTNITPTLYATNWNYLPYIRGLIQGPTVTATLLPPTRTPWATNTPTATATATATNTSTPTATNTVAPPNLEAPTLYDIVNPDQDGNFAVVWSAVAGADFYQLQQNHNNTGFEEIYRGPELSMVMSDMAPGEYCYNVRARGGGKWSAWAGEKCTTVVGEPEPEYMCEFETLYDGPRSIWSDVELLHDGRVFITRTSEDSASIFDPKTKSFKQVNLPQGGGYYAAVLTDGTVLLTVEGEDPHSMIYDPTKDEVTRLDTIINCLGVYDIFPYGANSLITYCGDNHGYIYFEVGSGWTEEYLVDIEYWGNQKSFVDFGGYDNRGLYGFGVSNGLASNSVYYEASVYVHDGYDLRNNVNLPDDATSERSHDKRKVYFIGGLRGDPIYSTVKEAYSSDGNEVNRIADMWQDRQYPEVIGLSSGEIMVLAGHSGDDYYGGLTYLRDIEIYVPSRDKWYKAGSLNITRAYDHKAIELLNGEIFVYGGRTEPGPGYSYIAPPEIGRCELKANN